MIFVDPKNVRNYQIRDNRPFFGTTTTLRHITFRQGVAFYFPPEIVQSEVLRVLLTSPRQFYFFQSSKGAYTLFHGMSLS